MKKTLNEEISRIKGMMGKIMNESFDDDSIAPHGGGFTQDGNPMGFDDFDAQVQPEEMGDNPEDLFVHDGDELTLASDLDMGDDEDMMDDEPSDDDIMNGHGREGGISYGGGGGWQGR